MIGYRAFRLRDDGTLGSLFMGIHWSPGMNTAACQASAWPWREWKCQGVVDPLCSCGFWCLPSRAKVSAYLAQPEIMLFGWSAPAITVIGQVETYGRHVEHEFGTRCEKAQVTELCADSCLQWGTFGLYRDSLPSVTNTPQVHTLPKDLPGVLDRLRAASWRYDVPLS